MAGLDAALRGLPARSENRRGRSRAAFASLALALLLVAGCGTTRIGDLLAEPGRYDGRTVRVEGTVRRSAGVLGTGAYELDDGTGTIVVISQGQGVPPQGARTKVKGRFESVFSFMGRSIAAILQNGN